jgi:hypothetical protein
MGSVVAVVLLSYLSCIFHSGMSRRTAGSAFPRNDRVITSQSSVVVHILWLFQIMIHFLGLQLQLGASLRNMSEHTMSYFLYLRLLSVIRKRSSILNIPFAQWDFVRTSVDTLLGHEFSTESRMCSNAGTAGSALSECLSMWPPNAHT